MAEIAIGTGVGWLLSPIINLIINKTQTYIENKFFHKVGVENDMKRMKTILRKICLIMNTVENRRIEDPDHMELMQEIKDAIYDAEDVMDEFEYKILKEKEKSAKYSNEIIQVTPQKTKASQVASSSIHGISWFNSNDKHKERVKTVMEKLVQAKESAETLQLNMNINSDIQFHEKKEWHLTSSILSEEIVGREWECEMLIKLLFEQTNGPHTIISIIGQGGIGKTTLAQMVVNDKRLIGYFDQKMWLTVSENFDMLSITKEMVKCVCENFSTIDASFDKLQRKIETELASKRILVIFDDVWCDRINNNYSYEKKWLQVLAPLKKAKAGSKIMLTSREDIVGNILGSKKIISLGELTDDDSWSLFELCAFSSENKDRYTNFEPIGRMIVNKVKKSTLAIKSVGTQLRHNSDINEWKRVLNEISMDTGDVMNILLRSYQHLPKQLQRCFAYCSIFPKDYHLKLSRLIHMWIANGFIVPHERKSLEDVANSYFNELVDRSFIQKIKNGDKQYYFMHDLMNDLACHVSKGECHVLSKGDSMENTGPIRHLSVTGPHPIYILMNSTNLDKIRTLVFLEDSLCSEKVLIELLTKLKRIRVLDIKQGASDLRIFWQCKHLRYLSFRVEYKISSFNDSVKNLGIGKLHQLSALFLRKSSYSRIHELVRIPNCSMSSLTMVNVSKLIKVQVGGMSQIKRHLRGNVCLRAGKEKRYGLDQLEDINNIKGLLKITQLENATNREEAIKAQLGKKENVTKLSLAWEHQNGLPWPWQNSSFETESNKYDEVLEGLSPNNNLEKLKIKGYGGAIWPSWLESNFLFAIRSIKLSHCKQIKMLPTLGQLASLQELYLEGLTAVKRIGPEFYGHGIFFSLVNLVIFKLMCLEEWSYPCNVLVFPKLHNLGILDCPLLIGSELEGFPVLRHLRIHTDVSNNNKIKAPFQEHTSLLALTKLEIEFCNGLIA